MILPRFIYKIKNSLNPIKHLFCVSFCTKHHIFTKYKEYKDENKDKAHALQLNHLASRIRKKESSIVGIFLVVKMAMTVGENPKQLLKDKVR